MNTIEYSLVIPVYKNEGSLPELLSQLEDLSEKLNHELEAVFVIDSSPDLSAKFLDHNLAKKSFSSQLIELSRNFGSYAAIRAGLEKSTGKYFAVMAADLQEPISLIEDFFRVLQSKEADVTVGVRLSRQDPVLNRLASHLFWKTYRAFIQKDMPKGGVDIFGCNEAVREQLLSMPETNSSLVGQLFWLGFRRKEVAYERLARRHGKSSWSLKKKLRYFLDSIFSFSDLPVQVLLFFGGFGLCFSVVFSGIVLYAKFVYSIPVPGYAATVLMVSFFGGLNSLSLGVIGNYVWRAYENTKQRPLSIIQSEKKERGVPRNVSLRTSSGHL
jgi:glycosyltransferase involved in cell wall biosynthesis